MSLIDSIPENETSGLLQLALENHNSTTAIDDEGWALIAPFGEHPKTRVFRDQTASGHNTIREQKYIQVLDHAAADALLARENSLFRKLKRALVGIPVYKGHGDLMDCDPKAVTGEREKIKLGVIERIRKTARGIEARFSLDVDGAAAVAAGWKLPSAFWWVRPIATSMTDRRDPNPAGTAQRTVPTEPIRVRPFKLISVALTRFPNISGVESLSNSKRPDNPDSQPSRMRDGTPNISSAGSPDGIGANFPGQNENKEPDMKLIAGWLIGNGVAFANAESPTETQVLEALKTVLTAKAGEVSALGNENSTLADQLAALETELTTQRTQASEATTALANEQTARKAERKGRAIATADLAIQRGRKTVAQRETLIAALENSANFDTDAQALFAGAPVVKIAGQDTETGKVLANEHDQVMAEYDREFKAQLALYNQDPVRAHTAVMAKSPAFAEKLKVKKA